jgi:hypothetical protein
MLESHPTDLAGPQFLMVETGAAPLFNNVSAGWYCMHCDKASTASKIGQPVPLPELHGFVHRHPLLAHGDWRKTSSLAEAGGQS